MRLRKTAHSGREVVGVLELEARGLADDRRVGVDLAGQGGERGADVAGDRDRLAGAAVDVSEQLDRGRLAVGPGHRQEPVRDRPPGQLELAEDLDPRARARRRSPAPPREPPGSSPPFARRRACRSHPYPGRLRRRASRSPAAPSGFPRSTPMTDSPRRASSRAAAWPERASPTTRNGPPGSGGRSLRGGGADTQAIFAAPAASPVAQTGVFGRTANSRIAAASSTGWSIGISV